MSSPLIVPSLITYIYIYNIYTTIYAYGVYVTHINIYEYFLPKFYPNVSFNVITELFLLFAEDSRRRERVRKNGELWNVCGSVTTTTITPTTTNKQEQRNTKKMIQLVNGNFNIIFYGKETIPRKKCASEYIPIIKI